MGRKHCGKEKLLIMSNFSFSHSVFKRLLVQTHKNQGLFGKGLIFTTKCQAITTPRKKPFGNFMEKGENGGNQYFLLFPQCFVPHFSFYIDKVLVLSFDNLQIIPVQLFTTQSRLLTTLRKRPFENIVGKQETGGDQHFLLFQQCFQPYQTQK